MDINPLSDGHCLVIPKRHCQKLHELPPEDMADLGPLLVKVAMAVGADDYNILQNNGRLAHQAVFHVHFHIIPKVGQEGLGIAWHSKEKGDNFNELTETIKQKLSHL